MAQDAAEVFLAQHGVQCSIQLREEYLRRLREVVNDPLGEPPDPVPVGNNLDMLRVASVEVVEAIMRQRAVATVRTPLPFPSQPNE